MPFLFCGTRRVPTTLELTNLFLRDPLIAVPVEGDMQALDLDGGYDAGPAEVSLLLVGLPRRQVTGAGAAMLYLAGGRQAETLLRPLVRFHLWHDGLPSLFLGSLETRPVIINPTSLA